MDRKIMGFLREWKQSSHRKPLILQGARQVGKTYSILEFGRMDYENVAYFNFETNPKLNETFEENISPEYLIPILSNTCRNEYSISCSAFPFVLNHRLRSAVSFSSAESELIIQR